ncbi:hypothetical protein [Ruegeria atlantica]|uniref:hypothetical protein n=1 Tax=Ruegeria atlantica TaxID=81569 RepID=UPI00147ED04F|nr:hypothetical protein [Ruegeria atlantica]
MFRILQHFILITILAVLSSQASAMFIQADPMDPTFPGVGTNRYAYSHGDPTNQRDPSGLATTYHDDGSITHYDGGSPEHAAIACGCTAGAQYMRELTQYYNEWREGFVSSNPGQHEFHFESFDDGSYFVGFGEHALASLLGQGRPGIPSTANSLPEYLSKNNYKTDRLGLSSTAITHILDRHGRNAPPGVGQFDPSYWGTMKLQTGLAALFNGQATYLTHHPQRGGRVQVGFDANHQIGYANSSTGWRSATQYGRVVVSPGIPGRGGMTLREIVTAFPVEKKNLVNRNH